MTMETGALITPTVRLARPLGEGGMGAVWVADHLSLERQVAVKLIRGFEPSPEARGRFEREAKAAARIASPHVVQIFDYGITDDGQPYIIMELLAGESLAERLARGPLPPDELAAILMQTASALASAHDSGVVHRDIKPANIFLVETPSKEPFVKVLDFGIAKLHGADTGPAGTEVMAPAGTAPTPLTTTGAIVGTPEYMSPEQLLTTDDISPRSDIWSLGVVAYEALAGTRPFSGETIIALSMAICDARYEPERVPEPLRPWFRRALAVKAAERFDTAMNAAKEFRALTTGEISAEMAALSVPASAAPASAAPASAAPASAAPASAAPASAATASSGTVLSAAAVTEGGGAAPGGLSRRTTGVLAAAAFVVGAAVVVMSQTGGPSQNATAATIEATADATTTTTASATATAEATNSAAPDSSAPTAPTSASAETTSTTRAVAAVAPGPAGPTGRTYGVADKCKKPCREVGMCKLINDSCYPGGDADCAQSMECRELGYCGKVGNICRAKSDAHCAASYRCKSQGECAMVNNHCAATQDAHCRPTPLCVERGRCSAKNNRCVPGSRADCMASARCKSHGECTPKGMICQASNDADCQASSRCASHGACTHYQYACRKMSQPKPAPEPAPE